jgi:hypothetical protein
LIPHHLGQFRSEQEYKADQRLPALALLDGTGLITDIALSPSGQRFLRSMEEGGNCTCR